MIRMLSPKARARRVFLAVVLCVLGTLVLVSMGFIMYSLSAPPSVIGKPLATPGISVTMEPDKDVVGISDGTYAFDLSRPDGDLKHQASNKLKQGDKAGALLLWQEALSKDGNDAESLIYLENQRVLNSHKPYITLIVGTMFTNNDDSAVSTAHDMLQGAYVAQKEFNDGSKLAGGNLLRILIANSGDKANYTTTVAQQIVQIASQDPTIAGIMGWQFSANAISAVNVLGSAKVPLPMVSATASSDKLTHISPYFFRVVPSNKTQAIAGAIYVEQQLHAKRVAVFVDPNDDYSSSLANDFSTKFLNDGNKIIDTEEYKVGEKETLPHLLNKAMSTNPDLIYFAGYAADLAILLQLQPNLAVMGGDALYELGGYTRASRPGFSHLHFTSFAYPDEWGIQGQADPPFFAEYSQDFDPSGQHKGIYGYSRSPGDAMLAYDAMLALLKGCNNAMSAGSSTVSPSTLQQGLAKIYGDQGIQGVTGQISWSANGDPVNKAVVVLYVDAGYIKVVDPNGVKGCFLMRQCSNTNG